MNRTIKILLGMLVLVALSCNVLSSSLPTSIPSTANPEFPTVPTSPLEPPQIQPTDIAQPQPQATSAPVNENRNLISLVPFNYTLQDAGDGWISGTVTLAFENRTGQVITLNDLVLDFTNGIVLETSEGITYPVTSIQHYGQDLERTKVFFDQLFIPPGFRFYRHMWGEGTSYLLRWRSAVAATPKRITFVDYPGLDFDLPTSQNMTVDFPFISPSEATDTIAGLAGKDLVNNPQGVTATFTGRCGDVFFFDPTTRPLYSTDWLIELSVRNNDAFQEQTGDYDFMATTFQRDGDIKFGKVIYDPTIIGTSAYGDSDTITLGPGQSEMGFLVIEGESPAYPNPPPVVVRWDNENTFSVYDLSECSRGK